MNEDRKIDTPPENAQARGSAVERLVMCFLVSDCVDHEGCGAIAVFSEQKQAEDFVKTCEEYDRKRPECQMGDGAKEWENHDKEHKAWVAGHPGGKDCSCVDNYVVSELPFYT